MKAQARIAGMAMILAVVALAARPAGAAATNHVGVGKDYTTIAGAVGATDDGGTIILDDAVHTENSVTINSKNLTIMGSGPSATIWQADTVRSNAASRHHIVVDSGKSVTVKDMTLRYGFGDSAHGLGASIYCKSGTVTAANCVFTMNDTTNTSSGGGAIYCDGISSIIAVSNCEFSLNFSGVHGGAIRIVRGVLQASDSSFVSNSAGNGGGAIFGTGVTGGLTGFDLRNCTFFGNAAATNGGGVNLQNLAASMMATVYNCTFVSNSAGPTSGQGGGLYFNSPSTTSNLVVSTIFADNTGGGLGPELRRSNGSLIVTNCLIEGTYSGTMTLSNCITNQDPLLKPLGYYGGSTQTMPPRTNSPAIGAGLNPLTLPYDQRGAPYSRTFGAGTDIGAVEFGAGPTNLVYSTNTFNEAGADDGSISNTSPMLITIENEVEKFSGSVGDDFAGTKVLVTNVPPGLFAVVIKTNEYQVAVSLTNQATAHASLNSITNLSIAFQGTAFLGGSAAGIGNASNGALRVSFTGAVAGNSAPVVTNAGKSVTIDMNEDGTFTPLTIWATDTDGDTLTWTNGAVQPATGTVASINVVSSNLTDYTYTPPADFHGTNTFTVEVRDGQGGMDACTVTVVVAAINDPPVNTAAPTVVGSLYREGVQLTMTTGTWNDAKDSGSIAGYTYQWQHANDSGGTGAADIGGATTSAYTPVTADIGKYLSVKVTATDNGSPLPAASNTVASAYVGPVLRAVKTFTAIASGRFNGAGTWDAPGGASGPPILGDTANIGGSFTVTTSNDNEVASGVTVNIQSTGKLQLLDPGTSAISPIHSNATVNVASNGTLEIQSENDVLGTINLNGGTLSHNIATGGWGNLAAGATLSINNDSFLTPIGGAMARINCPAHGTGKLTLTADAGGSDGSFKIPAASTWSGAWDFQGNIRFDDGTGFKQRWIPGDARVAAGKTVACIGGARTIKGTRFGTGTDQLSAVENTMTLGDGTNNAVLSPGDIAGGAGAVAVATRASGTNMTFVFNSNSTYVVDIGGTASSAYDTLTVAGNGTGTGNVQVVDGAKLTVNLWKPTVDTVLDAMIVDGTGAKIGTGDFTGNVTWSNTVGWSGLAANWTGPDLHVTGTYTAPVVTLAATTASAYENTTPTAGVFTVSRGLRTDDDLAVGYTIGGTATPGPAGTYTNMPPADYANATGTVTIANGASNATIAIWPVDDAVYLGNKTVLMTLRPGPYTIGSPSNDTVTVVDDETGNLAPTVDAGTNQTVVVNTLPTGPVTLNGSATDDGLLFPLTNLWSMQSGPGTMSFTGGATNVSTTATFDAAGTYVLQLVAFDGGLYGTGTVSVTVHTNTAPAVDAGPDQSRTFAAGAVALTGTLNPDDGLPAAPTFGWSKDTGPGTVTFGNSNALVTTATFGQAGVYVLRLTANDGLATGTDTLTVTLRAAATFTATNSGRFNAASTWDQPGGTNGPPLVGDTANIGGGYTVTTLSDNEVTNSVTVNIQNTGTLQLQDPGGSAVSPVRSNAAVNVASGGTLEIQSDNDVLGTINLNGGTLSHNSATGGIGNIAAGATLNINSNSFLTPIGTALTKINCPVHGMGKLTLTADAGTLSAGIQFAAASTWSGAWDFQGNIRFSPAPFYQRWIPGDARVAAGKAVTCLGSARTIKGTRSGFGADQLSGGNSTMTLGDGTNSAVLSPGDGAGGVGALTVTTMGDAGTNMTFVFNTNSTYVVDVTGTVSTAYDRLLVTGINTGTGNVQVVSGAKLVVNLWTPPDSLTLDATIIDGTGDKIGAGDFVGNITWNNSNRWRNLATSWVGPDLHVTGTCFIDRGSVFTFH